MERCFPFLPFGADREADLQDIHPFKLQVFLYAQKKIIIWLYSTLKAVELLRLQHLSMKPSNEEIKSNSKLPFWLLTEL